MSNSYNTTIQVTSNNLKPPNILILLKGLNYTSDCLLKGKHPKEGKNYNRFT